MKELFLLQLDTSLVLPGGLEFNHEIRPPSTYWDRRILPLTNSFLRSSKTDSELQSLLVQLLCELTLQLSVKLQRSATQQHH